MLAKRTFTRRAVVLCALLAALLSSTFPTAATAAQDTHPIDRWVDNCIAQDSSTAGMLGCLEEGYKRWDSELNYAYQDLRSLLNQQSKDALKKAQRAWIAYRDAEFETMNLIYGSMDGTMWSLAAASAKVEMVKARTLELSSYIETLRQGR